MMAMVIRWLIFILFFAFCSSLAILIYRGLRYSRKRTLKITHASIFGSIMILVIFASWAVYDSHILASPPIPNLYSLHSWIGLTAILLFILQVHTPFWQSTYVWFWNLRVFTYFYYLQIFKKKIFFPNRITKLAKKWLTAEAGSISNRFLVFFFGSRDSQFNKIDPGLIIGSKKITDHFDRRLKIWSKSFFYMSKSTINFFRILDAFCPFSGG